MSHIQNLLLNSIREKLEELSLKSVGFIQYEEVGKIEYTIDGIDYDITIEKLEKGE